MSAINFFSEGVHFTIKNKRILRSWIEQVTALEQQEIGSVNFIYCSDKYLLEINKNYLDHDYYTDIITFDNRDSLQLPIDSDIFISIDRIQENAIKLNISFDLELHRVMIHGILHLLGYQDKTDEQKKDMRKREEASLSLLHI